MPVYKPITEKVIQSILLNHYSDFEAIMMRKIQKTMVESTELFIFMNLLKSLNNVVIIQKKLQELSVPIRINRSF